MKHLFLACALVLGAVAGAQAAPQINVGTIYDYLDGTKSSYIKRIYNGGDSTAYVKVNVFELHYKADGTHEETPVQGMSAAGQGDGLIASPARLIIPAKGMQSTRLLYRGKRDQERYYRVRFVPVIPTKEDAFAVDEAERGNYEKTMSAGVNLLTGYGTIFFVRPSETRFDSQIDDSNGRYTLRNQGNSSVLLDNFKDCPASGSGDCRPTTKQHVMPGKSFSFTKEAGREYRFDLVEGESKKAVVVE